jgi:hypothetical protein
VLLEVIQCDVDPVSHVAEKTNIAPIKNLTERTMMPLIRG